MTEAFRPLLEQHDSVYRELLALVRDDVPEDATFPCPGCPTCSEARKILNSDYPYTVIASDSSTPR